MTCLGLLSGSGIEMTLNPRRFPSMKTRIRHIAVRTENPDEVSAFYQRVFDMKIVDKTSRGTVFMSDGYLNLTILAPREGIPNGIAHFGFLVDSLEPIKELTTVEAGDKLEGGKPAPGQHSEHKVHDPAGNRIDVVVDMWPI